jgi:hypothetical protein
LFAWPVCGSTWFGILTLNVTTFRLNPRYAQPSFQAVQPNFLLLDDPGEQPSDPGDECECKTGNEQRRAVGMSERKATVETDNGSKQCPPDAICN